MIPIPTETSLLSNYFIGGAKPLEMNQCSGLMNKEQDMVILELGMWSFYAGIRSLEYILYVSYNLPFKCWKINKVIKIIKRKSTIKKKIWIACRFVKLLNKEVEDY